MLPTSSSTRPIDLSAAIRSTLETCPVTPITVLMPVHNHEQYVGEAIRSVLQQTYRDFTLLLVDDGSTDRSLDEMRAVAGSDPRVHIVSGPNLGLAQVGLDAFTNIRSPYMAQVDSDDFLEPTALQKCIQVMEARPEVGMVYTGYAAMDANGKVAGPGARTKVPYSPAGLLASFMTFHFRLIRRSAYLLTQGIDPTLPTAHDYDLCLKLSEVTQVAHIPELLYRYRYHSLNMSFVSRLNQIECSKRAIENALQRRGLAETHQLIVEIVGKFLIIPRK